MPLELSRISSRYNYKPMTMATTGVPILTHIPEPEPISMPMSISMPIKPITQKKKKIPGERLLRQMHKLKINEKKKHVKKLDKSDMKRITKSFSKIMIDLN